MRIYTKLYVYEYVARVCMCVWVCKCVYVRVFLKKKMARRLQTKPAHQTQHTATHYPALQAPFPRDIPLRKRRWLHILCTATHCDTLQHIAHTFPKRCSLVRQYRTNSLKQILPDLSPSASWSTQKKSWREEPSTILLCVYVYARTFTYMYVCICIHVKIYLYTCVFIHMYIYIHSIYIYICILIYIHIYKWIHMYIYV